MDAETVEKLKELYEKYKVAGTVIIPTPEYTQLASALVHAFPALLAEREELLADKQRLEAEKEHQFKHFDGLSGEHHELTRQNAELRRKLDEANDAVQKCVDKMESQADRIAKLESDLKSTLALYVEAKRELKERDEQLATLNKTLDAYEDEHTSEVDDLMGQLANANEKIERLQTVQAANSWPPEQTADARKK